MRNWFSNQRSKDKKLVKQELPETIQPKVMCMMIGLGCASLILFGLFVFLES